jgi:hypothetical protein
MSRVRFERAALCVLLSGFVFSGVGMAQLIPAPPQVPQIPQGPPMPSMPTMPSDSQIPQGPPTNAPQQRQQQQDQERRNNQQGPAGFLGAWCAQGDPSKQASISSNGPMLNLTNESGSTSIGNLQGNNQIVAPEWQFVTGTLSGAGRRIDWSNGTFWARCYSGGGGGGGYRTPNLNGNWYPNGNRSLQCSIQQRRGNLTLQNENGDRATGSFNGKWSVTTNWQGTRISGTISKDGTRIDWSNGTYWIRYRLYSPVGRDQ